MLTGVIRPHAAPHARHRCRAARVDAAGDDPQPSGRRTLRVARLAPTQQPRNRLRKLGGGTGLRILRLKRGRAGGQISPSHSMRRSDIQRLPLGEWRFGFASSIPALSVRQVAERLAAFEGLDQREIAATIASGAKIAALRGLTQTTELFHKRESGSNGSCSKTSSDATLRTPKLSTARMSASQPTASGVDQDRGRRTERLASSRRTAGRSVCRASQARAAAEQQEVGFG